ncbi:hypothetical protein T484DRAFT_1794857 [Baffinella frigidus]|nr:hypothetical protein T484DRAFT_1794857 [Cryptophyta sp. CCMP2293]
MAAASSSQRSSDTDRPLKDLPVRLWFDNPAYCISPTVSPAASSEASSETKMDFPFPDDDLQLTCRLWSSSAAREDNELCDVLTPSSSASSAATREGSSCDASPQRQTVAQPSSRKTDGYAGAPLRCRSLPDTFGRKLPHGQSLLSYGLETASESAPDPDRPLKGLPIKFWFDNPAYCISPTASAASSPRDSPLPAADDVPRRGRPPRSSSE